MPAWCERSLKLLRVRNIGRVIIGYLNINSVRNKFDALKEIASQSLDILMIAETKLNATFPTGQFAIGGGGGLQLPFDWTEMQMAVVY